MPLSPSQGCFLQLPGLRQWNWEDGVLGRKGGSEYLSGPGRFVSRIHAPTVMVQGLPVPRQDLLLLLLLLFLKLLLLLLLLQGLEVGVLLLQLPLQTL